MDSEHRLELLRWLIDRSDRRRESYSNRALVIIAVSTAIIASGTITLGDILRAVCGARRIVVLALVLLGLVSTILSMVFALAASIGLRHGRKAAPFNGDDRVYVHPGETFKTLGKYECFCEDFRTASSEQLVNRWLGELWVGLKAQGNRYAALRISVFRLFRFYRTSIDETSDQLVSGFV